MNSNKVVELENLLSEALPSVVIRRGQSEQLRCIDYRKYLQRCRTVYDPMLSLRICLFHLEIGQTAIRDRVLEFVNRELVDHIRDGRIHSASFAFVGGMSNGSPVGDVVQNLVRRAIIDGPAVAAQAFIDCTTNSSCSFYQFFLLSDLRIDAPTRVFDGITLIPLPESASELPAYLPIIVDIPDDYRGVSIQHLLARTLLRVEYEASPVFRRPEYSSLESEFEIKIKSEEVPDFDLSVFCEALGLATRRSIRPVMRWISLLDYEIFNLGTMRGTIGGGGYSRIGPILRLDQSDRVEQYLLNTIPTLYQKLVQLPPETLDKLRIPIDRWMKSMEQDNPIDQIIDLGISLESLYVPGAQSEVSLRFALHAAWHLGQDEAERKRLRKEFQEIYAARSDVMHTGQLRGKRAKSSFNVSDFVRRAQDLCWQGITSVIDTGKIPDWNNLIMGQDLE